MRMLLILSFLWIHLGTLLADGFKISVEIKDYDGESVLLAYYYGDKMYIKDTIYLNNQGRYVYESGTSIDPGIYLIVLPPDNNFFQVLVPNGNEDITVSTVNGYFNETLKITGCSDNLLFLEYLGFLNSKSGLAQPLSERMKETLDEAEKQTIMNQLLALDKEVKDFQKNLVDQNPGTFTAEIVGANIAFEVPEFEEEDGDEDVNLKKIKFAREHYFDRIDLTNRRLLRTPFLFEKVNYFINNLYYKHPDSIAIGVSYVLDRMIPAQETFQFYLIHYLNEYAKSNIVGMDGVYVQLVDRYYATGKASWTDEEQLEKIIENANGLKPTLIGKTAPDITLEKKDGSTFKLHSVKSPYTILYFWRYDCGHCKESTPVIKSFYEKFKDKGVKIVAVCTKFTKETEECWKYAEENGVTEWMHGVDTYHRSKYMDTYFIKSTPQIFILDKDKKILIKKIGADQLESVMENILQMESTQ
jgi:peroxiredoxin